jgi:hypothetical protein
LSGHANLMPGLVTGRTFLQVAACTTQAQHSTARIAWAIHRTTASLDEMAMMKIWLVAGSGQLVTTQGVW